MRIRDWSSDVCSSDLPSWTPSAATCPSPSPTPTNLRPFFAVLRGFGPQVRVTDVRTCAPNTSFPTGLGRRFALVGAGSHAGGGACRAVCEGGSEGVGGGLVRSEEHTSELQSLMRRPYA